MFPLFFIIFTKSFFRQENAFYFMWKALLVLEMFKFLYFCFPFFFPVSHWLRGWSKINLKVYDVSNILSKILITHLVWHLEKDKRYDIKILSIDRVLRQEHFYGKKHAENVHQKLVLDAFLILVNNQKQPSHVKKLFYK